jgi:alginate O-acetyltransferase complex protein AlgI
MVFSSTIFLFAFLPAVIICYYAHQLLPAKKLRNAVLLFFSYLFYLYGAAGFLMILILSTLADYMLGLLIERKVAYRRLWLGFSLLLNLGLLAYFKYANFSQSSGMTSSCPSVFHFLHSKNSAILWMCIAGKAVRL